MSQADPNYPAADVDGMPLPVSEGSSEKTQALPTPATAKHSPIPIMDLSWMRSYSGFKRHMMGNVDPEASTVPLSVYCFMTGFIDAVTFSAIFVWCGFQTGNTVQLSLALARLFSGPAGERDTSFHIADQQALTSILTFLFGAFIGRLGDRIGAKTRAWLFLGTFIQALFTMAAAICVWQSGQGSIASSRGDPAWTNATAFAAIGFASASLGLQGIMGKRVNTQFATTIVLTTVWCELMADPKLFVRRAVISRDHKILAVFALFVGGFVGRAIVDSPIGGAGAFGVGTGFRVIAAISWFWVPSPKPKKN